MKTTEIETEFSLNAQDRCDSCGAQAYIVAKLPTGSLYFCAHHGRKVQEQLQPIALSWHDESHLLNV
ncbi:MAG: hypothetical protein KF916_03625 [Microbacteriaceae bacterium]|nr:hypothetical protein [Microbacteriaceae bacterium]